jgi:hypothetical protein
MWLSSAHTFWQQPRLKITFTSRAIAKATVEPRNFRGKIHRKEYYT